MINLIIFGAPGSGKGTQSDLIAQKYSMQHISTGDLLRAEMAAGTELGQLAESYIAKGELVPDDVIIKMLSEKLEQQHADSKGIIFDGFPRTVAQAETLEKMLARYGQKITALLEIEVVEAELIERMLKRGKLSGRSDDNLETIQHRIRVYHDQTAPVIDFYKRQQKYHHIAGTGSIDDVALRITTVVDSLID